MAVSVRALAFFMAVTLAAAHGCRRSSSPQPCHPPPNLEARSIAMLEPALAGLTFTKPVQLLAHPVDRDAWLVVEHTGLVHIVRDSVQRTYFDISDRVAMGAQWGLQEIAFHPKFPDDPRVF